MDHWLHFNVDLEAEKPPAAVMLPYCRLFTRCFRTTFRAAELSSVLLLLLWIFIRLPIAIQIAADFFRHVSIVVQSPLFVFLFFNAIIFALVIMKSSRLFTAPNSCACGNSQMESTMVSLAEEDEVVVFQENHIIITSSQQVNSIPDSSQVEEEEEDGSKNDAVLCASESDDSDSEEDRGGDDDDELSNEEFRRTVEEFIAKNLRFFRREETSTFNDN